MRLLIAVAFFALFAEIPLYSATAVLACAVPMVHISAAQPTTSTTLSCPQFDPALGTLLTYRPGSGLSAPSQPGATVTIENTLSSGFAGIIAVDLRLVSDPLPSGVTFFLGSALATGPFDPGFAGTIGANPAVGSGGVASPSDTGLNLFIGTGIVEIPGSVISAPSWLLPSGVLLHDYSADLLFTSAAIVYEYEPVPEPETWLIAPLGLLLAMGRRLQKLSN